MKKIKEYLDKVGMFYYHNEESNVLELSGGVVGIHMELYVTRSGDDGINVRINHYSGLQKLDGYYTKSFSNSDDFIKFLDRPSVLNFK